MNCIHHASDLSQGGFSHLTLRQTAYRIQISDTFIQNINLISSYIRI